MVTPQESYPNLAKALGLSHEVYFKREDLHPYGSHKGRSIPLMIDKGIAEGIKHFVISSSGNAALAAGLHIQKLNRGGQDITLEILAGKNINPLKLKKLEALKDSHILLSLQERPLQVATIKSQDPSIRSLRQSNDDTALAGYESLAEELAQIKDLKAVFMGTSSGTTMQALGNYFKKNGLKVELHIVQTSSSHRLADGLINNDGDDEKSIADAIVDQVALRKDVLQPMIEESGGSAWIVKNEEIRAAQEIAKKNTGVDISTNSALSVAGLMQAVYTGKVWDGSVVCMICGD